MKLALIRNTDLKIGAKADEVIMSDSTSINLFKLAWASLQHQKNRKKIVSDDLNFPSELYILQSVLKAIGATHRLALIKSHNGITIDQQDIEKAIGDDTALVSLSHVGL